MADTESAIRQGRYFKSSESKKHTLCEAVDRYIKEILPAKRPSTIRDQTHQLNWWKQQLGTYTLADISTAMVTEAKQKLAIEPIKGLPTQSRSLQAALRRASCAAITQLGAVPISANLRNA